MILEYALIDGQTFEYHDEVFGIDYKKTKHGNLWISNNVFNDISISATINGETKFYKYQTEMIFIKHNEKNKLILKSWLAYYLDEDLFKFINEKVL